MIRIELALWLLRNDIDPNNYLDFFKFLVQSVVKFVLQKEILQRR